MWSLFSIYLSKLKTFRRGLVVVRYLTMNEELCKSTNVYVKMKIDDEITRDVTETQRCDLSEINCLICLTHFQII